MPDKRAMAGAPMPESVEAAWEEFWRLHDWGEDGGEALVNVAVRASERSRLLNPSDELVEVVEADMVGALRRTHNLGALPYGVINQLARAALQAAAKEI